MYKRVSDFLNSNDILAVNSLDLKKKISADKAVFSFTVDIFSGPNNKMQVV
jgi:hypothetical protein